MELVVIKDTEKEGRKNKIKSKRSIIEAHSSKAAQTLILDHSQHHSFAMLPQPGTCESTPKEQGHKVLSSPPNLAQSLAHSYVHSINTCSVHNRMKRGR